MMDSDIVIQKIYSAFEGEFNPGFIQRNKPRHSDCFVYYVYGDASYIFENYTLNVSMGTAFYISKESLYNIKINEKSKYICIDFDFCPSPEVRRSVIFGSVGVSTVNLFSRFLHIHFRNEGFYLPKAFSLIYEIYYSLLKRNNEKYSRYSDYDKIVEYALDHYTEQDISLASISAGTGLSESHIRRCLSAKLHITPIKYINHLRLEKAKRLLLESNFSILEIASATGFEDPFYFSRVFKKQYGTSPRAFRLENEIRL